MTSNISSSRELNATSYSFTHSGYYMRSPELTSSAISVYTYLGADETTSVFGGNNFEVPYNTVFIGITTTPFYLHLTGYAGYMMSYTSDTGLSSLSNGRLASQWLALSFSSTDDRFTNYLPLFAYITNNRYSTGSSINELIAIDESEQIQYNGSQYEATITFDVGAYFPFYILDSSGTAPAGRYTYYINSFTITFTCYTLK